MNPLRAVSKDFDDRFGAILRQLRSERGWRQIELAVEIPVDHSLVSRWETGAVLPTGKDVDQICRALSLDEENVERLRYAWRRERDVSHGDEVALAWLPKVDWVESIQLSVESVRALRKSGQPRTALMLGHRDALYGLDFLRSHPWRIDHPEALSRLSELLLEECKAGLDYLPQPAVRAGCLSHTIRAQAIAASGAARPLATLFHAIAKEGVAYVSGNIGDAHELSRQLLTKSEDIPPEWLPEVVRACAINSGKLSDVETLQATERALKVLLDERDDLPPGTHAFVLEGLARGWAGVEPRRALEVLDTAWRTRNSSEDSEATSSLRFVQLVRSQAEIELALHYSGNVGDTAAKLERALDICSRNKYDKYSIELEKLAQRIG
ncbi:multiprotein-bridging factor 1 family protein [Nonomuraea sp. NPDC049684]|uniref:multiprotein-bridging factor 1 family protein n=1 Tax=Nonomuraea sp. NPDC049684 TaxID=3364356 RepID=UPI0037AC238B